MAGGAFLSILTPALAINGNDCRDLWPFKSEMFLPEAFVASKLTGEPKIKSMMKHYLNVKLVKVCLESNGKVAGLAQKQYVPKNVKTLKQATLIKEYLDLKYLSYQRKSSPPKVSSERPITRPFVPAARLTSTMEICAL